MALSLADLARAETDPLKKMVMMNLIRYSDLMSLVPFEEWESLTAIVTRWKTMPTVAFRKINAGYTESTGSTEQVSEGLYALGGDVQYDRVFEMVKNVIEDPKKTQTNMKTKAIAYAFNNYFINGDHASDVDGFEGLNKRIATYLPSRQSVSIGSAFDVTASTANEHKFIDSLHNIVDLAGLRKAPTIYPGKNGKQGNANVPMAKQGALLMNRDTLLGVAKVLRRLSLLDTTQDNYGREFDSFDGVPMIDVGVKDIAETSNEIITNAYGSGTNETRIFAVRFGMDDGLTGVQLNNPDVYDPLDGAEKTTGPQKLLRIDWWCGLAGFGSYYAARLTGVKDPTAWT